MRGAIAKRTSGTSLAVRTRDRTRSVELHGPGHRPALGLLRLTLLAQLGKGALLGAAKRLAVVKDAAAAILDRNLADLDRRIQERRVGGNAEPSRQRLLDVSNSLPVMPMTNLSPNRLR